MSYIRTNWVARVGTALNRFLKSNESSGSVELTNDPTGVTTAGTPFTVANMNKIEEGIYDAHVVLDNNINQNVKTTASPTFANATIAGHNIDSELDTLNGRVNQGVKTTDSPTFASVNTGFGANDVYKFSIETIDFGSGTISVNTSQTMASMVSKEIRFVNVVGAYSNPNARDVSLLLPSGGTYYVGDMSRETIKTNTGLLSGGDTVFSTDLSTGVGTRMILVQKV